MAHQTVPVLMAFDRRYFFPSCVAIHSVLEHADPALSYRFYILTTAEHVGMDDGCFALFAAKFPNFSWEYRCLTTDVFESIQHPIDYISAATFYRLLAARLFPELDRCLYLDGDIAVFGDVAGMLDFCDADPDRPFSDYYLAGVRDMDLQTGEGAFFERHRASIGFSADDFSGYVNAGVLVMNLRKIRTDGLERRFLELVSRNFQFADQDILNVACRGRIRYLPVRYNLLAGCIANRKCARTVCGDSRDREDLLKGRPVVCHYAGRIKPWQLQETPWDRAWYTCAERVPATPELKAWIAECGTHQAPPWELRTETVRGAGHVVLYGYTHFSRFLCETLLSEGYSNLFCFCDLDRNKQGQGFRGIPCRGPEVLDALPDDTVIVICAQSAWPEISRRLQERGIPESRLVRYRARDYALVNV